MESQEDWLTPGETNTQMSSPWNHVDAMLWPPRSLRPQASPSPCGEDPIRTRISTLESRVPGAPGQLQRPWRGLEMGVQILMAHPFLSFESRGGDLYLDVLVKGLMHETGSEHLVIRTLKEKKPHPNNPQYIQEY